MMAGGSFHRYDGSGWRQADFDSTYMSISIAITPFEMYQTLTMLADPDTNNLEELTLVGSENVDGAAADHTGTPPKKIGLIMGRNRIALLAVNVP